MRFQVHGTKFIDVNQFIGTRWAQWQFVIGLRVINLIFIVILQKKKKKMKREMQTEME